MKSLQPMSANIEMNSSKFVVQLLNFHGFQRNPAAQSKDQ
jgi:hypothetical protein